MNENEERYYGCCECVTQDGEGCVLFQIRISASPIVCPCGYRQARFTLITEKIKQLLISQSDKTSKQEKSNTVRRRVLGDDYRDVIY